MSADTRTARSDEAVVPSLGEALGGLAAVLGQGRAVAREAGPAARWRRDVRAQLLRAHREPGNPPDNPKAHYWVDPEPGPDPQAWLAEARQEEGSWWEAWAGWIGPHAGDREPAPTELGSAAHPALEAAPGSYVLES